MKQLTSLAAAVTCTMLLCGCQNLPHFEGLGASQPLGPRVLDITEEVQCEILKALQKSADELTNPNGDQLLVGLQSGIYVASVNLTLDVTENEGVNPSLSYIEPLNTMATNLTASISAQASEQQHRNINITFTLIFSNITQFDSQVLACRQAAKNAGLKGDLGIEEILATGLKYTTDQMVDSKLPYLIPAIGVGVIGPADPLTGSAALAPSFGSTVDFTLVYGLGGGPTWTLSRFSGPGPSTGTLLNGMRTNKDTLVLSFARVTPTSVPNNNNAVVEQAHKDTAAAAAGKAAQDNVTRMILQQILPP